MASHLGASHLPAGPAPTTSPPARTVAAPPQVRILAAGPAVSEGRPQRATLAIPDLGIAGLVVMAYRGVTDDVAGTAIEDTGRLASPYGPRGGVGPGGVGNYQVTGHRNSAGGPLLDLPGLAVGSTVVVVSGRSTYVYRIVGTRRTSFRSARSLREQRAAVPGHPGAIPTRAMITISTCATQEDGLAGNTWHDALGNPEHRFDKIGVLVTTSTRGVVAPERKRSVMHDGTDG